MGSDQLFRTTGLLLVLAAANAGAAYDANDLTLGASEAQIKKNFPNAYCRELEWPSRAAERRCDDSRISFAGVDASVTFYLKRGAVEGFDVRLAARELRPHAGLVAALDAHAVDRLGALEAGFLRRAYHLRALHRSREQDALTGLLGRAPRKHHFQVGARLGERLELVGRAASSIVD